MKNDIWIIARLLLQVKFITSPFNRMKYLQN